MTEPFNIWPSLLLITLCFSKSQNTHFSYAAGLPGWSRNTAGASLCPQANTLLRYEPTPHCSGSLWTQPAGIVECKPFLHRWLLLPFTFFPICYLSSQNRHSLGLRTGSSAVCTACRASRALTPASAAGQCDNTHQGRCSKGMALSHRTGIQCSHPEPICYLRHCSLLSPLFNHWNWGVVEKPLQVSSDQ